VTDAFKLTRSDDAFVYRPTPRGPAAAAAAPERPRRRPPAGESRPVRPRNEPRRASAGERVAAERQAREALPNPVDLLAAGEAASAAGDYEAAAAAFRKAAYLEPDHPIPHLHLGLALEAAGHDDAAARAYAAARAAVDRADTAVVEAALEGYRLEELVRLLDSKLGGGR